jgi:large subunit ribosomal protein L18
MDVEKAKRARRDRRKFHVRKKVHGTGQKPRLSVFRSNRHIYCQLIDDENGKTIAAVSTRTKALREAIGNGSKVPGADRKAAAEVGKLLAGRAKELGIEQVVFDRGGYKFHGRIQALADAARKDGMKF